MTLNELKQELEGLKEARKQVIEELEAIEIDLATLENDIMIEETNQAGC